MNYLKKEIKLANGITMNLDICGEGQPVLCLAGFGCSNYIFKDLAPYLISGYRYIFLDNRGMGKSSKANTEYSIKDMALDAQEAMKSLGHQSFHIIGVSMGGFIAQELALIHEQEVLSLSLLCTTSGGSEFIKLPFLSEETISKIGEIPEPQRSQSAVRTLIHPSYKGDEELVSHITEMRIKNPADVKQQIYQKRAVENFLIKELPLSKIKCPTMILSGDEDRFVSPINSKILQKKINSSELYFIPKTDHLFFSEKPRDVAFMLGKFLKKNTYKMERNNDCIT